jgi:UDP-N-acetylglucosamine 4,6-dehydratase
MSTEYSIYLISNDQSKHSILQTCLPNENIRFFDGTDYPSFSKLVNDAVLDSPTELVLLMSDKVRPTSSQVSKILSLLQSGYAFVGLYRFGCFGLHKETFRRIGGLDTRYIGGGFEDYDYVVRLIEADLAFYITEEVTHIDTPSKWRRNGKYPGYSHWVEKWKHLWVEGNRVPISITRTIPEEPVSPKLGASTGQQFKKHSQSSFTDCGEHVGVFCHMQINSSELSGKRIAITGGTGSWGQALIHNLLSKHNPAEITVLSRGELAQVNLQRRFPDERLKTVLCDVRDVQALTRALKSQDVVFHLAALKHVPICEDNPEEAIKTNIDGTQNVIHASQVCGVERVIYVSSDKACEPVNLYGLTKAVGEKLIINANNPNSKTKFVCIRGGNVLGSSGSVVPLFIDLIKNKQNISITDRRMTRFFLTQDQAIVLLLSAASKAVGGETLVMRMPSCNITQLAHAIMRHKGKSQIIHSGMRPGEKIHEVLVGRSESHRTKKLNQDYYVILPEILSDALTNTYDHLPPIELEEFSSSTSGMSDVELDTLLRESKLI